MVIVVSPNVIDCLKFDSREGKWEGGGRETSEKIKWLRKTVVLVWR